MYIIDETYFNQEYYIPNLNEMDSDNMETLESYIDKYVRFLLQKLLGYELFKDLDNNIASGVMLPTAPQKWLDLVNGKEYTNSQGKLVKWQGLIYSDGAFKSSLLTPFVYYSWLKDRVSTMTGTGEKVIDAQNATNVNSNQRLVTTWNDFLEMYQGNVINYSPCNKYYHNGVPVYDYFGGGYSDTYVNLIQFLKDNEANYPDAQLQLYKPQNQFGL